MFHTFHVARPRGFFDELLRSIRCEPLGKGRSGAVLVRPRPDGSLPLVRTTTTYQCAPQAFSPVHDALIADVEREGERVVTEWENSTASPAPPQTPPSSFPVCFNSAMFEHYTDQYRTMKFHSDQALDLDPRSYMAVFSCYADEDDEDDDAGGSDTKGSSKASARNDKRRTTKSEFGDGLRALIVKRKRDGSGVGIDGDGYLPNDDERTIPMTQHSVILFSCDTNQRHLHRIVLPASAGPRGRPWIGITFRFSQTFVSFRPSTTGDLRPMLRFVVANDNEVDECSSQDNPTIEEKGVALHLASAEEKEAFLRLRHQENAHDGRFDYPLLAYTLSPSDLMPLEPAQSSGAR